MVNRVIAKNPQFEVILELDQTDGLWKGSMPSIAIGEYYVDIYAWDLAGNQAYMSKALFVVDTEKIHIYPLLSNFYSRLHTSYYISSTKDIFKTDLKEVFKCNVNSIKSSCIEARLENLH